MECESIFSNENQIKCENEAEYSIRVKSLDVFSVGQIAQLNVCKFHKDYYVDGFNKEKLEVKKLHKSTQEGNDE